MKGVEASGTWEDSFKSACRAIFLHPNFHCCFVKSRNLHEKIGDRKPGNRYNGVCERLNLPEAHKPNILTTKLTRDPQRDTTEVDPQYLEIITIHDRNFQKYSIDNSINLVPVDEVY